MSLALPAKRTEIVARNPVLSPALSNEVWQVSHPHPDVGAPKRFAAIVQAEARDAIVELTPLCFPVTRARLERWIQPIGAVVANAPVAKSLEYNAWMAGMLAIFGAPAGRERDPIAGVAIGAFTDETARECAVTNDFWPTAKAIYAVVSPDSNALRDRLRHLHRIADAETEEPMPPLPAGPPSTPHWVGNRGLLNVSGPVDQGDNTHIPYHAPIRTREEQLAALGFPDGVKSP